ncbi:MAG: NAD(P)H-dependent oxidoreductase [Sulfurimonas sp.]|nr:NAD(P)H-dependent oxidoreductase [Sulfurimonas sp.]MDD3834635.1 NAD(P)H-dependent oxidoreductase [Sulfurimonas sp.]
MKKVLIINGHQRYEKVAEGKLTKIYIDSATEFFEKNGFLVKHSVVESDYDVKQEVEKFVWADYIVFQHPIYWMGVPWITKKYIDEVFSAGANNGIYINDGRSRSDATKCYGSGGLMQDKSYMLSLTYNCPTSEFSNKDGFFEGLSLDEANVATHKTFQFCGANPLETYSIHDVYKGDLNMDAELENFKKVLEKNFI